MERGQSSEEVRVRNQMVKESARPQALLYVVPKVCASAIWPFLYARWLFLGVNFRELRQGELRRIPLPRTRVNSPLLEVRYSHPRRLKTRYSVTETISMSTNANG